MARRELSKVGKCTNCHITVERTELYQCTRCGGTDLYCSRECQIALWPKHKSTCVEGRGAYLASLSEIGGLNL